MQNNKELFLDVEEKIRRNNKILFSRDSVCLQKLIRLIEVQKHRTIVMWALDCAYLTLKEFEAKYPHEIRPRICLGLCEKWAKGQIKMPIAKRAILDSHTVAKEINDLEYGLLCQSIAHAGATVHVETHALGLIFYELTSIIIKLNKVNYYETIKDKLGFYYNRLKYWEQNINSYQGEWASFLLDDSRVNKEKLLNEKRKLKKSIISNYEYII